MEDVICGCFGLTREQIIEDVKTTGTTKAGTGCGACKTTVDAIVEANK